MKFHLRAITSGFGIILLSLTSDAFAQSASLQSVEAEVKKNMQSCQNANDLKAKEFACLQAAGSSISLRDHPGGNIVTKNTAYANMVNANFFIGYEFEKAGNVKSACSYYDRSMQSIPAYKQNAAAIDQALKARGQANPPFIALANGMSKTVEERNAKVCGGGTSQSAATPLPPITQSSAFFSCLDGELSSCQSMIAASNKHLSSSSSSAKKVEAYYAKGLGFMNMAIAKGKSGDSAGYCQNGRYAQNSFQKLQEFDRSRLNSGDQSFYDGGMKFKAEIDGALPKVCSNTPKPAPTNSSAMITGTSKVSVKPSFFDCGKIRTTQNPDACYSSIMAAEKQMKAVGASDGDKLEAYYALANNHVMLASYHGAKGNDKSTCSSYRLARKYVGQAEAYANRTKDTNANFYYKSIMEKKPTIDKYLSMMCQK